MAVMCRNHRGFVDASLAVAKLGADLLYLNTAFAGPQLVDVLEREKPRVVDPRRGVRRPARAADVQHRVVAWTDGDDRTTCRPSSRSSSGYPDADLDAARDGTPGS